MDFKRNRIRQLEMLGTVGAAVLGAGVALLFKDWLFPYAVPAVLTGIVVHGWAMYAKNRLEVQSAVTQAKWEQVAYWVCWLLLLLLIGYIGFQIAA